MAPQDPERPERARIPSRSPQPDRRNSQSTQGDDTEQQQNLPPSALRNVQLRSVRDNQPSIRLRRIRSSRRDSVPTDGVGLGAGFGAGPGTRPGTGTGAGSGIGEHLQQYQLSSQPQQSTQQAQQAQSSQDQQTGRRRSSSEPQRWYMSDAGEFRPRGAGQMPSVPESSQSQSQAQARTRMRSQSQSYAGDIQTTDFGLSPASPQEQSNVQQGRQRPRLLRPVTNIMRRRQQSTSSRGDEIEYEYDPNIVDILDVVDPEVATLSSITNIQNTLFIPSMGRLINRHPTYRLSQIPDLPGAYPPSEEDLPSRPASAAGTGDKRVLGPGGRPPMERVPSTMTERFYAVRPHNTSLVNWTEEEIAALNDHVRHMLHSRRNKMKRSFKGFGQYVRQPLGFLVTLYATLITLFGLAWVLFLIGWIYVGEKQLYVINVIDTVLVTLFAVVGVGLIPWRIRDTYHMLYIAYYHQLTWKLRKKLELPRLQDKNDLPSEPAMVPLPRGSEDGAVPETGMMDADLEAARNMHEKEELPVLTAAQQRRLQHHQDRFSRQNTYYKPHETETHYAFPLRLLITIVTLLDCHSMFQLSLSLCTWCIPYQVRPSALTATLLCCSITVNITAGVFITIGGRRTRKKDVVERMFRQQLTQEAMKRVNKAKAKEERERAAQKEREEKEKERERNGDNNGRLERIDEGREREPHSGRTSRELFRPALDFLAGRKSSDRATRPSGELSRKSIDRVGRFDPVSPPPGGNGGSSSAHHHGNGSKHDDLVPPVPIIGSFPEEEEEEELDQGKGDSTTALSHRRDAK